MSACGHWAFFNTVTGQYSRWLCGSGKCPREECRTRFWSNRVRLVSDLITEHSLIRFFTLTLDRKNVSPGVNPWDYIPGVWSKFRKRMNRRFDDFKFVAVLESHKNEKWPHVHGFTNVWLHQSHWSTLWSKCGGGEIVWIEKVKDGGVGTYVNKAIEVAKYVGKGQLLDGYKHRGNHRTIWRSKGLKAKFELKKSTDWCMIKEDCYNEKGELLDYLVKRRSQGNGKDQQ